jgi:hypothetical protein
MKLPKAAAYDLVKGKTPEAKAIRAALKRAALKRATTTEPATRFGWQKVAR